MAERLNIVENRDVSWEKYNLLDTKTGKLLLNAWALTIERCYLYTPDARPYYLVRFYDPEKNISEHILIDDDGNWLTFKKNKENRAILDNAQKAATRNGMFRSEFVDIKIWDSGQFSKNLTGPVLSIRFAGEDGYRLVKLDGTILTKPYSSIGPKLYAKTKTYVMASLNELAPRSEKRKFVFLTYPDFRQVGTEVFDDQNYDVSLNREYEKEGDFIAIVKHRGRWKVLRADGSLEKIAKKE